MAHCLLRPPNPYMLWVHKWCIVIRRIRGPKGVLFLEKYLRNRLTDNHTGPGSVLVVQ